jgi:hypothetical protein
VALVLAGCSTAGSSAGAPMRPSTATPVAAACTAQTGPPDVSVRAGGAEPKPLTTEMHVRIHLGEAVEFSFTGPCGARAAQVSALGPVGNKLGFSPVAPVGQAVQTVKPTRLGPTEAMVWWDHCPDNLVDCPMSAGILGHVDILVTPTAA